MDSLVIADAILEFLGETPYAYGPKDKWPVIIVDLFFYALPFIFLLLFAAPFLWHWYKKRVWTWKTIAKAVMHGFGMIILGLFALYILFSYMQGMAYKALHGG